LLKYSTLWRQGAMEAVAGNRRKGRKHAGIRRARVVVDIGSWFAYNTASLSKRGILIRRKQMAKKTLKKAKKLEATKPLQSHAPFKK
jgi:hypothetical protein